MALLRNSIISGLLLALSLLANANAAAQADADAARDLILLAADGPVLVRIELQVDGRGFRARWRDYADTVFAAIDADGNQFLDPGEADNIPTFITSARQASEQRTLWSQMDVNPADGKVSPDEFREFVVAALGRSLAIRPFATSRAQAVGLFARLDRNGDGMLSHDEIVEGYETLRAYDIDANEVIGIDELLPPQDPTMAAVVRPAADTELDLPLIELRDGPLTLEQTVEILLNRYARGAPSGTPGDGESSRQPTAGSTAAPRGLTGEQLGLDAEGMARYDLNRDGRLDADELVQLLKTPQPRVRFLVELKVRSFGRPQISLVADEEKLAADVRQESSGRLELSLAGIDLTLAAARPRTTTGDASRFFKLQFRMADADKNQYIDPQEFAGLSLPETDFAAVDADGDGKIFLEELERFVDRANGAADSQLTATVSIEGRTLFEMLDENGDLRLTRREFQQGPARLAQLARGAAAGGQGEADPSNAAATPNPLELLRGDFQNRYHLSFRSGESPLLPSTRPQDAAATRATPVVRDDTSGPDWFRRMDRNRDGDVSQREFLGSPEMFRRLDLDGDGLITAAEAEMAGMER